MKASIQLERTLAGEEPLCYTCRNARIIRGFSESEELIYCDSWYPTRLVPFRVRMCTEYDDRRVPYKKDLEEIAYRIASSKSASRTAGFVEIIEPACVGDEEND